MSEFTNNYANLLITQYRDKPKARAEIELYASFAEDIYIA